MSKCCTRICCIVLFAGLAAAAHADPQDQSPAGSRCHAQCSSALERGFADPPPGARLRAYWWWLNGNVTRAAITRDLEEMADKGFGGALIFDAGGAEQHGNDRVPHGATFLSPEWRELYRHALREADRLGLEMGLNIQSGWNLGGPTVSVEDAPKRLVWSATRVSGPARLDQTLPTPEHTRAFYRDVAVVAYPLRPGRQDDEAFIGVIASSEQPSHPAGQAVDGNSDTFWVSRGDRPGDGPSRERPQWLQFNFSHPVAASGLGVRGRPGYGPRECELHASEDGESWRVIASFHVDDGLASTVNFEEVRAARFRLVMLSALDPRFPDAPRNVQVSELRLVGPERSWPSTRAPLQHWQHKALHAVLGRSAPDTSPLLTDLPATAGEEDLQSAGVVDLTERMLPDGVLEWDVPEGTWEILRFGSTLNPRHRVSTHSDHWDGYAVDPYDADAFRKYWQEVVEPLMADAGPLAGRVLKYLHTDSWEVGAINWTPTLREEFQRRRGYDLLAFLPVVAGRIVDDRHVSNRFLHDFRKTMGDLAVDHYYRVFSESAGRHGLQLHPQSGGPHGVPIDALRCLGVNDAPMSEFWARSWRHRVADTDRFFVKQGASAAHTYGRRLVLGEGFTTIGPHWQETLWDNLKPTFDRALCEGLNLLFWHTFTCSPQEMGLPGQAYFAGTHLNPNATWWPKSGAFLAYINRCQFLLQQGLFVADAVYYYGDHVPNFAQLKASDPARVLPGYDYDVATEEVVLTRMSVRDGRIVLPDGMSYRVLVLPDHRSISLPVLRKLKELVSAGAAVVGPRPETASGLQDYPQSDQEVALLTGELWGDSDENARGEHRFGRGRVIGGRTAREVLLADGVQPDFEFTITSAEPAADQPAIPLDYIHRRAGDADIYFVSNQADAFLAADAVFRVSGKRPELWDPVTGDMRFLPVYADADGRTTVPLQFGPYGSWFVLFRSSAPDNSDPPPHQTRDPQEAATPNQNRDRKGAADAQNFPAFSVVHELTGPWTLRFDPEWGGPALVEFPELVCWTTHRDEGVRFYSGTAAYEKTFDLPERGAHSTSIYLDLGDVRQLAEVRLNGRSYGVLWAKPFRVEVTEALQASGNRLEIEVVNFWPNRIIGDASLPARQRRTQTNIRKLTAEVPLMESGLLGPVTLQVAAVRQGG